jgi:hypothetical protein
MPIRSPEFWATAEAHDRILNTKLCLAGSQNSTCDSPIIRAHTIPRSQLRRIALQGHVYTASYSMANLNRNDGALVASRVGINQFSVLNCFCANHDKAIFSDLEDRPLVYSPKQIALLHYRAVGAEFYKKLRAQEVSAYDIKTFSGRVDRERMSMLESLHFGQHLGIMDAFSAFQHAEKALESDKDLVSALVIYFRSMPTVMTVGAFLPEFDYNGRAVQTLGTASLCQGITFNILAASDRASLCMTWSKDHKMSASFARSFVCQRPDQYTTLAIQTAFEHLENTRMDIVWWDGLKPVEQNALLLRMLMAGSMFEERKPFCLSFSGVKHDDWEFDKYEFLNA